MSNGPTAVSLVSDFPNSPVPQKSEENDDSPSIHRSASHTQVQDIDLSAAALRKTNSISRSFSENVLAHTAGNVSRNETTKQGSADFVKPKRSIRRLGSRKRRPTEQDPEPKYTVSKFIVGADEADEDVSYERSHESTSRKDGRTPDRQLKTRSVSGSITNFARRSWVSASRSPSPSPSKRRPRKDREIAPEPEPGELKSSAPSQQAMNGIHHDSVNGTPTTARRNSFLSKRPRRPLSSLLSKGPDTIDTPSVPPIPKSFSTDKLPSLNHENSISSNAPALPKSKSFERLQSKGLETPRKKDELWSAFRNLDGEYQKFQSRPSTLKTSVIRSALLPFLRSYAEHPSTSALRPEDLDRRTVILNKWWTGLLEMLNGRHGETVSGNDRPAVLEAVTALMVRPEWTMPSLATSARTTKTPRASLKSRSTTSLGSTMTMSSDFLADSVYHNVKNTFSQNLLAQMAYVVDKMSMRNVPASVVAFCGKATAYAFFYCDGVAEILVRLWATPSDTLKRMLVEYGIPKGTKLDSVSEKVCTAFPPCLMPLTFKSLSSMTRHLRSRPHVPIATAYISWHSPWVSRWAGKDTDLFYVFTKFYTDLVSRFLPEDPSTEEKVVAPGWLLVQAQILSVLDATIQRLNNPPNSEQGPPPLTFDDMLGEADANATVLPLPGHGAVRAMAENRLILLLRDCLSGSTVMTQRIQSIFAESFSTVLKATARRTSIFDHNACFALCDFLEEALAILARYYQASTTKIATIDWSFWLNVCKQMLLSQNSMTEVRLYAFLYVMWPTITEDGDRKREICVNWLLTKDIFQAQFNHWCPMVRAFFMRLLAWRIGRLDRGASELNHSILKTLHVRLQESWRYFIYHQKSAGKELIAAASSPAPGRRLLIMRNDVQPVPAGMFHTFDGILSSTASKTKPFDMLSSSDQRSHAASNRPLNDADARSFSSEAGKKRWNPFRSILSSSSPSRDRAKANPSLNQQDASGVPRTKSQLPNEDSKTSVEKRMGPSSPYRSLSFKFSLEWFDREGNILGVERRLNPPKLPPLANMALDSNEDKTWVGTPLKPEGAALGPSKYAGRALAEWALLMLECKTFVERRLAEGIPTYQMVETPTLGVEPFRKA